jgi:hypothetical protein
MKTTARSPNPPAAHSGLKLVTAALIAWLNAGSAFAQVPGSSSLNNFINPLKDGLNLITIFGFIAGCVMVMGAFLNARRDENWKMTVIYGIGVAGAVVLMKALFAIFSGSTATGSAIQGF